MTDPVTRRRSIALVLGLCLAAAPTLPMRHARSADPPVLHYEEAELRERMMTALAVADGIRTQGRTLYLANNESRRLWGALERLARTDHTREDYITRLAKLEDRQKQMAEGLDRDFATYLGLVEELAKTVRPRLKRTGEMVAQTLNELGLTRLQDLQPIVQGHLEALNRNGRLTASIKERWLAEIDDSRAQRQERFGEEPPERRLEDEKGEEEI